jgi:hypothetical protein
MKGAARKDLAPRTSNQPDSDPNNVRVRVLAIVVIGASLVPAYVRFRLGEAFQALPEVDPSWIRWIAVRKIQTGRSPS